MRSPADVVRLVFAAVVLGVALVVANRSAGRVASVEDDLLRAMPDPDSPHQRVDPVPPANREKPRDVDREGAVHVGEAMPTQVRSAEGIPFPTRPAPESSPGQASEPAAEDPADVEHDE